MGSALSAGSRQPRIIVTTAEQASRLLKEAETCDEYRKKIFNRPIESKARANHNYFPLADSQYNREVLQEWCNNFLEELSKNSDTQWIPKVLINHDVTVYLVNLQFSADAGMPHTRPLQKLNEGIICIPGGLHGSDYEKRTLIHELIHIFQRIKPSVWVELYKKYWKMTPYAGTLPQKYEEVRRINPDTLPSELYLYKGKWVIFCVFKDITHPDIRDTVINYYNVHTKRVWSETPDELRADEIFGDYKIIPAMREHPAELSAWICAEPERFQTNSFYSMFQNFS